MAEKMIMFNRQIIIREVTDDLGILIGSCHSSFSQVLELEGVVAKVIPKLLNIKFERFHIALSAVSAL